VSGDRGVTGVDPRLVSALTAQLERWRATLADGAERVGWKLGIGEGERIGPGPVIGHLTSATHLEPGALYHPEDPVDLRADAEVALALGCDVDPDADRQAAGAAIAGFGAALELVDLGGPSDDPESVVATNVYHRAFALGPLDRPPPAGVEGRLIVNGEVRDSAPASQDCADLVRATAKLLGAVGERLRAGDRLITGSVVQVPIEPGDEVTANLGHVGQVRLSIAGFPRAAATVSRR
jgi:2-keto-4-pentenoate hydratase